MEEYSVKLGIVNYIVNHVFSNGPNAFSLYSCMVGVVDRSGSSKGMDHV